VTPRVKRRWRGRLKQPDRYGAKRHGIDPFAFLRDMFGRVNDHPQNRLEELLPDRWLAARTVPAS
jgi:hypothetical protein